MFAAREIDEGRQVGPLRAYGGALHRALPILVTELGVLVVLVVLSLTVVLLPVALVLLVLSLLGTALILGTPLPFGVSNAVAGIVYALFVPLVALNAVYVYADVLVRDELEPRAEKAQQLPAEASIT